MIKVTKLAGQELWINNDLIRTIERTPDTILCFIDGTRIPVLESPEELQIKILEFKSEIMRGSHTWMQYQSLV